jgi:hypothetical protein
MVRGRVCGLGPSRSCRRVVDGRVGSHITTPSPAQGRRYAGGSPMRGWRQGPEKQAVVGRGQRLGIGSGLLAMRWITPLYVFRPQLASAHGRPGVVSSLGNAVRMAPGRNRSAGANRQSPLSKLPLNGSPSVRLAGWQPAETANPSGDEKGTEVAHNRPPFLPVKPLQAPSSAGSQPHKVTDSSSPFTLHPRTSIFPTDHGDICSLQHFPQRLEAILPWDWTARTSMARTNARGQDAIVL